MYVFDGKKLNFQFLNSLFSGIALFEVVWLGNLWLFVLALQISWQKHKCFQQNYEWGLLKFFFFFFPWNRPVAGAAAGQPHFVWILVHSEFVVRNFRGGQGHRNVAVNEKQFFFWKK